MIRNKDILIINEILTHVKEYQSSLYTKGKVIKNLKAIKEQLEVIQEIQKNLVDDEFKIKLQEYYDKKRDFILSNELEGKLESDLTEELLKEYNDLFIGYEDILKREKEISKEYEEYLNEECDIEIAKIDMEKDKEVFKDIKINPNVDYIVEILFEI